jgi:BirA family biotin operon repressor/biotin-[acetyl-CoA-carboxylase] ligase
LLGSLVLRDPARLLPLAAGVAVAEIAGVEARVKWPNDVLIGGRKVAGILVEGRPQERWAVLGIGLNVAVAPEEFPPELRERAVSMGLEASAIEATLERLLRALERWLDAPAATVLDGVRGRDALRGSEITWSAGRGRAAGIDDDGRLLVETEDGVCALEAGEVHLVAAPVVSGASADRQTHHRSASRR